MIALWISELVALAALGAGPAGASTSSEASMWEVLGQFETFPDAKPYAVADELQAAGASFKTAGFTTQAPPQDVIAFYRKAFERDHLVPFGQPGGQQPFVGLSAFDPHSGLEKTVVALPGHGGPTHVMLSISQGDALLKAYREPGDQTGGLPIPAGAKPARSDARDGVRHTTTVTFSAALAGDGFVAWLRPALSQQGWTEVESQGEVVSRTLRFQRANEGLDVLLVTVGKATEVTYLNTH